MIRDIELEFDLVKEGFNKVKRDNLYLLERIDALEKANRELLILITENGISIKSGEKQNPLGKEKTFIGNKTSMKVHYFDCGFAKKINEDNREYFADSKLAIKTGFSECQCISLE
jgi:hypothetical protein